MLKSASMIRIGILGTGFGARVLLPAFKLDPRVGVTAIYGRNPATLNTIATQNKLEAFADWRELINSPNIDAVAIALPPPVQAQVLKEIKKHVFAEKPVGLGSKATKEIATNFDENKIIHALDFEFPFLPAWQDFFLKQLDIGEVQHLKLNWHVKTTAYKTPSTWKINLAQGGGVLANLACHSLHYTEWIMGESNAVTATLSEDEAQIDVIMEFANQRKATLSVSMDTEFGNGHRLELFATKGALTLDNPTTDYMNGFTLKTKNSLGEKTETYPAEEEFQDGRIVAVNRVIKRFLDGIESGKSDWPNLHDGARNELLIEACRKSHSTGQKIKL